MCERCEKVRGEWKWLLAVTRSLHNRWEDIHLSSSVEKCIALCDNTMVEIITNLEVLKFHQMWRSLEITEIVLAEFMGDSDPNELCGMDRKLVFDTSGWIALLREAVSKAVDVSDEAHTKVVAEGDPLFH